MVPVRPAPFCAADVNIMMYRHYPHATVRCLHSTYHTVQIYFLAILEFRSEALDETEDISIVSAYLVYR